MRKKIKKLICILSAVVIAFSSFIVSAAEDTIYSSEEILKDLHFYCAGGSSLEELIFEGISSSVEYSDNICYVTYNIADCYFSDENPEPFFSNDGIFVFLLGFSSIDISSFEIVDYFVCYFPNNCVVNYDLSNEMNRTPSFSGVSVFDSKFFDDSYNGTFVMLPDFESDNVVILSSDNPVDEITIAVSLYSSYDPEFVPVLDNRDFFTSVGLFFTSSVNWVVDIFRNVVLNAPLLVIVAGFSCVGFIFAILYKLVHSR